jgi:hypothetical protein
MYRSDGSRYRVEREGGTAGHSIAILNGTPGWTPCVAAQFDRSGGVWRLGMNSGQTAPNAGVIPGQDAGHYDEQ